MNIFHVRCETNSINADNLLLLMYIKLPLYILDISMQVFNKAVIELAGNVGNSGFMFSEVLSC